MGWLGVGWMGATGEIGETGAQLEDEAAKQHGVAVARDDRCSG